MRKFNNFFVRIVIMSVSGCLLIFYADRYSPAPSISPPSGRTVIEPEQEISFVLLNQLTSRIRRQCEDLVKQTTASISEFLNFDIKASNEAYVPSVLRYNLTNLFPEEDEGGENSHTKTYLPVKLNVKKSFGGQLYESLCQRDAEWTSELYQWIKASPEQASMKQSMPVSGVTGSYNSVNPLHKAEDPDTWLIPSWKDVNIKFYDGDGTEISLYSNAQAIASMASVTTYYTDWQDYEAFDNYIEELWNSSHSYSVKISDVYYCTGCIDPTVPISDGANTFMNPPLEAQETIKEVETDSPPNATKVALEASHPMLEATQAAANARITSEETQATSEAAQATFEAAQAATKTAQATSETAQTASAVPQNIEVTSQAAQEEPQAAQSASQTSASADATVTHTFSDPIGTNRIEAELGNGIGKTSTKESGQTGPATDSAQTASNEATGTYGPAGSTTDDNDDMTTAEAGMDAKAAKTPDLLLNDAGMLCPGHVDLSISAQIIGLSEKENLYSVDKPFTTENKRSAWTPYMKAYVNQLFSQDWKKEYGLSITEPGIGNPLSSIEIDEYLNLLPIDTSAERRSVIFHALHSVGKIPYYYGGKPKATGYENNYFAAPTKPDHRGRVLSGLDCSGWISWVYWSATGKQLGALGTSGLIREGRSVNREDLKPGDIIVRTGVNSHVVMFLSWSDNDSIICIHETGGSTSNVTVSTMEVRWPYYRALLD